MTPVPLRALSLPVVLFCLGACAAVPRAPDPPLVRVVNLRPVQATVFEQAYDLTLAVENPNPFDLPVTGMAFELRFNDENFARGVNNRSETVPAYGRKEFRVEARGTLGSILRQLAALQEGAPQVLRYGIRGRVSVRGWAAPLAFEDGGEIRMPPGW